MGLNLDLGIYCLPKPLSEFLHRVSRIEDCPSILSEIHGFVDRLEEERRKIDAFKRELPLCMILLNEAIGRLREETRDDGSAREGLVASNRKFDDGGGAKVENDKKNWMRSAQLWISNSDSQLQLRNEEQVEEEDRSVPQNSFPSCIPPLMPPPPPPPIPLTLKSSASDMVMNCRVERSQLCKPSSQQPKKERRRRWSPELHRKFIDVLQNLGGSQVATPKQIRELMQVEGLTNDEVKSHLQKYRIHIRKHAILTAAEASRSKGSESGSISRSESPQGPLGGRGYSSNGGHSSNGEDDNEEAKSDGESCKNVCNGKERVHFQF